MIRALLRKLGLRIHKGWRDEHPSGYVIRCIGCGEQRTAYQLGSALGAEGWWETSDSGDGSCGPIPELPTRFY